MSGTILDRPELWHLLLGSYRNNILLVEQIDRLPRLYNNDWMKLKKQIEQNELRIASLDTIIPWQSLSDKTPSLAVPTNRAELNVINNMFIYLMAAMLHKDWLSRCQRQKQRVKHKRALGIYGDKQADQ